MKTIVVNLFGEPSCGKSTASAYTFSQLKIKGANCELVTEYAKDKVYENNSEVFKNQEYIFGKQSFRMSRLNEKVEVIITDSPLFLPVIYNQNEVLGETFNKMVVNVFKSYNNYNLLLLRNHVYKNEGRMQNEEQSKKIRDILINKLNKYGIECELRTSSIESYNLIVEKIVEMLKGENKDEQ